MSEFKIEKGLPVVGAKRGAKPKYPFRKMEIGDSIFIDGDVGRVAAITAHAFAHRNCEYKFMCRKVEGGYRIWRVKP